MREAAAVTVGMFDGVHRGHQKILGALCREALRRRIPSAVLTFAQHPQTVMRRSCAIPMINTPDQKKSLLHALGIDRVVMIDFDRRFARISPEAFVKDLLLRQYGMQILCVGYDFVFGKNRRGNLALLRELSRKLGFALNVFGPMRSSRRVISSTGIRRQLALGRVEQAARWLGRPYAMQGKVVRGLGLGKRLGFPTCNIRMANDAMLPDGVYAVWAKAKGLLRPGVLNVGSRPTLSRLGLRSERAWEVHLWDVNKNLYGKKIEIFFMRRLRAERTFRSLPALAKQIRFDVRRAKRLLEGHKILIDNTLRKF